VAVADPIARLVKELARLPGIGEKTAQRLAFHILDAGSAFAEDLAAAITGVVRDVRCCSSCQTLTDRDPCPICADPQRDARLAREIAALEAPYRRELAARAAARGGGIGPELEQFGWLLEELRVASFAQELRTPVPVSAKRLAKLWQTVRR